MHLVRLTVDRRRFAAWASRHGLAHADTGYLAHQAGRLILGADAPQPFRAREGADGLTITGYAQADADALRARAAAGPAGDQLLQAESVPVPALAAGQRVAFDLLMVPTRRRRGREQDVYLARRGAGRPAREAIYLDWLADKLSGALRVETSALAAPPRVAALTRRDAARQLRVVHLPVAWARGTATITDPADLTALLAGGVGRHAAFGAGALLLRPA